MSRKMVGLQHLLHFVEEKYIMLTLQRARADSGVSSAGFSITVQPAANAGAIFFVTVAMGPFHYKRLGVMQFICFNLT